MFARRRFALTLTVALAVLAASLPSPLQSQTPPQGNPFNGSSSHELLGRIASALVAHNPDRMLRTFDLSKMTDGPSFKQQITSLFSQTTVIRVHFDRVQTSMEEAKGIVVVEVEMEAENSDERIPPLHKQAQLRLVAEASGTGWRFTDVQPRTFFSTQP